MKTSVIIPAYNEEDRIEQVIKPLISHQDVNEIIIIDDGSSDGTYRVAKNYNVKIIRIEKNVGKAEAIKIGLKNCNSDIIILLDADLVGLTSKHIDSLICPLMYSNTQMTIGIFKSGRFITDLAQKIAPNLSGQRAFKAELIKKIINLNTNGYSLEVAMSHLINKEQISVNKVILKDITHIIKEEKVGLVKGFIWRMKMYKDIIKYWLVMIYNL